jgi:hypothetical protein
MNGPPTSRLAVDCETDALRRVNQLRKDGDCSIPSGPTRGNHLGALGQEPTE